MTGCSAWSELRKLNGVGDIVVKNWLLVKLNWNPQKKKRKKKSQIYWYHKINGALRYHITFEVEFNKKLAS